MGNDLNELQGTWAILSLEVEGAVVPAGGATITITQNRFETASMGAKYSGRVEVNESSNPKSIALHFESGPEAGNVNHGIYQMHAGQWRLCLNMTGGPSPSEFKTAAGSGCALELLVRPGAAAQPVEWSENADREAVAELQGVWAMVSCVRAGQALPPPFVKSGKRTIAGTQSTLHFGPQLYMQSYLSSDSGGPDFIRLEHTAGEGQGTRQLGIYELDGKTLKTCFGAAGRARPTKYESTAIGGETYSVWKRAG